MINPVSWDLNSFLQKKSILLGNRMRDRCIMRQLNIISYSLVYIHQMQEVIPRREM